MALIKKYKSEVVTITNPIQDVYVVTFKPLEKKYKYNPGQFLHLALDPYDPTMAWPDSRCFSMQSSSDEQNIKITFAKKGSFTTRMSEELKPGREFYLKLPYGDLFSKNHSKENCLFIAGGTGITPYLSLFTSKEFSEYKNPRLYFGIREESHNLYAEDLMKSKENNSSFQINVINQKKDGILNIESIFEENGKNSTYFISGPPIMIKNFKNALISKGLPEELVRTDDWE